MVLSDFMATKQYGTRGKSKMQLAQTSQVSTATINATQDVANELNEIMVVLPSSQGTVSPSAVRAASREREKKNGRVARSVPTPPPRPSVLKNKVGLAQKKPVAKARKTVVVLSPQVSNTDTSSSEGEQKSSKSSYVSRAEFLAVKQQLEATQSQMRGIQEKLTTMADLLQTLVSNTSAASRGQSRSSCSSEDECMGANVSSQLPEQTLSVDELKCSQGQNQSSIIGMRGTSSSPETSPPKRTPRAIDKAPTANKNCELSKECGPAASSRKDVKLRSYNGDGNVEQFLAQFHVTAALAEWPREDWGSRLATALDGRARQVLTVEPLTGKPEFEKLVALLRSRFGPESSPELWRQSLENRKRGEKETLAELSHNILEMASKAYPALELEIRKALAVAPFIRALQDEEQRRHVYAQAPRTMEEAVKAALAFENASKIEQRATVQNGRRVRAVTHDDEQLANPNEFARGRGRKQEKGGKQSEAMNVKAVTESSNSKSDDKIDGLAKSIEALATTLGSRLEQVAQQLAHSAQDRRTPQQGFGRPTPRSSPIMQQRRSPQETQQSCWNCGSTGHFKWECPEPHQWGQGPQARPNQREAGNGSGRGSSGQTRGPQFQ